MFCLFSPEMMTAGRPGPLLATVFCSHVLGEEVAHAVTADPEPYNIAIVDLMFNECGLALAHRLQVPTVGYWAFSFSSLWQVLMFSLANTRLCHKCVCLLFLPDPPPLAGLVYI
jgi:hypothetical protein